MFKSVHGCRSARPLPAHDLRRGDAPLRLRQARPARDAGADRPHRRDEGRRVQGLQRPPPTIEGRAVLRRCACPAAASCRAARSTTTPSSSTSTAPRAWPTSRSTMWPRAATACSRPIVKNLYDAALQAVIERTGATDGDLIFFGADTAKVVNDALGALRPRSATSEFGRAHGCRRGLEAAVGGRFPDVRVRRGRQPLGRRCIIPSPRPKTATRTASPPIPARRCPRPTTWC